MRAEEALSYVASLDLGQAKDYSALVVLEGRHETRPGGESTGRPDRYAVVHAQRFELGTSYPRIVRAVHGLLHTAPLSADVPLLVDATGCGVPVVDAFRETVPPLDVVAVTITAGQAAQRVKRGWHVAKVQLVSAVQRLLQERRLAWPKGDPVCELLMKELSTFKVKITAAANETFESWRERDHDDLVLSLALACWFVQAPVGRVGVL